VGEYFRQPSEMRSVRSGTESTRSAKRKKRPGINTAVTPAQIFAQNLSDAVLDAEGNGLYLDRQPSKPVMS
jgi:hypothetical protein